MLSSTGAKLLIEYLSEQKNFNPDGSFLSNDQIIDLLKIRQTNDTTALEAIVDHILSENASQVEEYKNGKTNLFGFFVGQCMKASKGQGNPKIFTDIITKKLS